MIFVHQQKDARVDFLNQARGRGRDVHGAAQVWLPTAGLTWWSGHFIPLKKPPSASVSIS